jgi:hypothetical protein
MRFFVRRGTIDEKSLCSLYNILKRFVASVVRCDNFHWSGDNYYSSSFYLRHKIILDKLELPRTNHFGRMVASLMFRS